MPLGDPPNWLTPAAADEWRRLAPTFEHVGLTVLDADAATLLVETLTTWKLAISQLRELGPVVTAVKGRAASVSPYARIAAALAPQLRSLLFDLGLMPHSRSRAEVVRKTLPESDNEWAGLL
jgi:P27 family predicted phage terminase small subunit